MRFEPLTDPDSVKHRKLIGFRIIHEPDQETVPGGQPSPELVFLKHFRRAAIRNRMVLDYRDGALIIENLLLETDYRYQVTLCPEAPPQTARMTYLVLRSLMRRGMTAVTSGGVLTCYFPSQKPLPPNMVGSKKLLVIP